MNKLNIECSNCGKELTFKDMKIVGMCMNTHFILCSDCEDKAPDIVEDIIKISQFAIH